MMSHAARWFIFATCLCVWKISLAGEDSRKDQYLRVELVPSDMDILVGDGIIYRIVAENISRSMLKLAGPTVKPRYSYSAEWRVPAGDWSKVEGRLDKINAMSLTIPGLIELGSGESRVEYGQILRSRGGKGVFNKPGSYEVRAKLTCSVGTYLTKPVMICVRERPKNERPPDEKFDSLGFALLDEVQLHSRSLTAEIRELLQGRKSGSLVKTLKMRFDVEEFMETGQVHEENCSFSEAFEALSVGLDDVRLNQLGLLLADGARRKKRWKDMGEMLEQVKDDSALRQSLYSELRFALRGGCIAMPIEQ